MPKKLKRKTAKPKRATKLLLQLLEKTSRSETWRMAAAAEAEEIQSYKIAKTRKP